MRLRMGIFEYSADGIGVLRFAFLSSFMNLLFLKVVLPEPSTLILYFLFGNISTIEPVLSHLPLDWILTAVFVSSGSSRWAFLL